MGGLRYAPGIPGQMHTPPSTHAEQVFRQAQQPAACRTEVSTTDDTCRHTTGRLQSAQSAQSHATGVSNGHRAVIG